MLKTSTEFICSKFREQATVWKRKKKLEEDPFFVAPDAKALGTRFESKKISILQTALPVQVQNKMAFISILKTLRVAFENENFLRVYLEFNKFGGNGHTCKNGEYIDFCCGKIYQNSEIFKGHMNSLQLQIYQDDFEVCNPIGSKRTIHKVCGVYFTIRNWPNNSRLNHVYPIALCNTDDLKSESTDFNNIWRLVADEIKVLESVGINISKTLNLRGSISNVCADNAGANTCLGFAEGFNAVHSCRICELPKTACQTTCNEQLSELRTIEKYEDSLKMLAECTKVNYAQTKGIRMNCDLNKLNSFHVVQNYCIDIMHDLNEGVVPFLMRLIFNHCIEKKIFTRSTIITKSQYFDYGKINKKNIPSQLNLEKDNLNQNASQSICLFRHLPFILYEYENQLKEIWDCFISLQTIVQIVHSRKITEKDLITLRVAVSDHLQNIQKHFRIRLLPKHHNLTHYETVIRAIGPLICHTTIRYEAKHQQFKQIAKTNKNFKDLTATLAWKHQKKNGTIDEKIHSYTENIFQS